ncbi:hypothetical protein CL655_03735 [bacterium]|nr:hypothetical protein [bacterium]|tara:strand:+ start:521 stop:781 length:261 start_codon:yes stop_codon:yes gene_type:complete
MPFVTFGSLAEGDYFVARRGRFYVKETLTLFNQPPDLPEKASNAFGFVDGIGMRARFDELTLVERYDPAVHGQPAAIVLLEERRQN